MMNTEGNARKGAARGGSGVTGTALPHQGRRVGAPGRQPWAM